MKKPFDFSKCFIHNIRMFKVLGYWKPDADMKFKGMYNFYTFICSVIWVVFLLSQLIYMIENRTDVNNVTAALSIFSTFTIDILKIFTLYANMDSIKVFIKNLMHMKLYHPKNQEEYEIAVAARKHSHRVFFACLYLGLQTDLFWWSIPFLGDELDITFKGWFPWDWHEIPYYQITYLFQSLVALWNALICVNLDTFYPALAIQIGVQCDILCATLDRLHEFVTVDGQLYHVDEEMRIRPRSRDFSKEMYENLLVCLKHHQHIMAMSSKIEDIYRTSSFVLIIGGVFVICSSLLQLSIARVGSIVYFTNLFYLICMNTEQFVYCWFGNEIIVKSSRIYRSTYNTPWIDCDVRYRKLLLQMMHQAQGGISQRAGGLITLSTEAYTSVLRTAYSYFTVLQQI